MIRTKLIDRELNPYLDGYYLSELERFEVKENTIGTASITMDTMHGRIDGYMYRTYKELPKFPVLSIDGLTWMSLTPMEVESHFMPIHRATGRVVTGGLGLGYYVQRVLDKPEVEAVVAYETNPDVIALYRANFGQHPKLTIQQANILEMKGETFDSAYIDIYDTPMNPSAPADMSLLLSNNHIQDYRFWTMEAVMLEMIHSGYAEELRQEWLNDATTVGFHLLRIHANNNELRGNGGFWYDTFCNAGLL